MTDDEFFKGAAHALKCHAGSVIEITCPSGTTAIVRKRLINGRDCLWAEWGNQSPTEEDIEQTKEIVGKILEAMGATVVSVLRKKRGDTSEDVMRRYRASVGGGMG